MEEDEEFINDFRNERIDRILVYMYKTNEEWKQEHAEYSKHYEKLKEEITKEQFQTLDKMLDALNGMTTIEVDTAYKKAVEDYLKFMNNLI